LNVSTLQVVYVKSFIQLIQQILQLWTKRAQGGNLSAAVEELTIIEILGMDFQIDANVRRDLIQPPALFGGE
jgi:hypothetical protein